MTRIYNNAPTAEKNSLLSSKQLCIKLVFQCTTVSIDEFLVPGSPTPNNFDHPLVYIADGVYDPDDPDYEAPTGMFFQKEIMGRTDEEIEQNRQGALAFFEQRFGIDATSHDGVAFESSIFDPCNDYRAHVVSGQRVPSEGWVVRDGGWRVHVTAPDGVTLGGEFDGMHVPQNASMVFGDYNIKRTLPGGKEIEPIIIHYQSGTPIIRNADRAGGLMFRCELISEAFGHGIAQGIVAASRWRMGASSRTSGAS